MKFALCNEVVRELPFAAQCDLAAALGYDGIELAPFTLHDEPHLLPAAERQAVRRAAADAGVAITGLHWLLVGRPGRIRALERFIDHVLAHDRVWCCRRIDIARHWRERHSHGG